MNVVFIALAVLLVATDLQASNYYVAKGTGDDTRSCSTAQNTATPKLTIASTVACATSPGDHVRIHGDSDGLTSISNPWKEQISLANNGTAGNIITIEPWPSTGTVFWQHPGTVADYSAGSLISGQSRRYIRITGMYFKSVRYQFTLNFFDANSAIDFNGVDTNVHDIEIDHNTFNDCGPASTHDFTATPLEVDQLKILRARDVNFHDNVLIGNSGYGVGSASCYRINMEANNDSGRRKHRPSWAPIPQGTFCWQNSSTGDNAQPGGTLKRGGYHTYKNNIISDPALNASGVLDFVASGVRLDQGGHDSLFTGNRIRGYLYGLYWEASSNLNVSTQDIVYNGHDAIINGGTFRSAGFITAGAGRANGADNNTWDGDVSYNNGAGFLIRQSKNPTIKNSIAANNSRVQILTMAAYTSGAITLKNNSWWTSGAIQGSTNINYWQCPTSGTPATDSACTNTSVPNKTFDSWVIASGETAAVFGNPKFHDTANGDFSLDAGSPDIGAGIGGVDIGAYPQGGGGGGTGGGGGGTLPVTITLVQLNGSVFTAGDTVNLTWGTNGAGNVKISLSRNSGVTWEIITDTTANDGSYSWVATAPPGTHGRIEVRSIEDDSVFDRSDSDFAILPKFLILRQ